MADTYGAISFPVSTATNPPAVQAAGDPLLGWTADFAKAVLLAYCNDAWQAVAPGTPVVRTVVVTDPDLSSFNDRDLPALHVYRPPDAILAECEWAAEDYDFARGEVVIQWVPPPSTLPKRQIRLDIVNAIVKSLDRAIENSRDPAWVVAGDTDPDAAALGSVLSRYAGWTEFCVKNAKRKIIELPMVEGPPKRYQSLAVTCYVEELLVQDLVDFDPNASLDATFQSPDQGTGLGAATLGHAIYT